MSSTIDGIVEGTRVEIKRPISTVSIYVEDKHYFTKAKSTLMERKPDCVDADVTRALLSKWMLEDDTDW